MNNNIIKFLFTALFSIATQNAFSFQVGELSITGNIYDITHRGDDVFVGGVNSINGHRFYGVARYNLTDSTWYPLGLGLTNPGRVNPNARVSGFASAVLLVDNYLYVGGNFLMAGDVDASHFARYNLESKEWESLNQSQGFMEHRHRFSFVQTLAFVDGKIFMAGWGTNAISIYNTIEDSWSSLSSNDGSDFGDIEKIYMGDSLLYVAGSGLITYNFNTTNWTEVSFGKDQFEGAAVGGEGGKIYDVSKIGDILLVAGDYEFYTTNKKLNNFGFYNVADSTWADPDTTLYYQDRIRSIALNETSIFIAGGPNPGFNVHSFDRVDSTWTTLEDSFDNYLNVLHIINNKLFVGGQFETVGEASASKIATYNLENSRWEALGTNIASLPEVPDRVTPSHDEDVSTLKPEFTWNESLNTEAYNLQLSDVQNFDTVLIDTTISDTVFTPSSNLQNGTEFHWRIRAVNESGTSEWSNRWSFSIGTNVSNETREAPYSFILQQNYPNPFNPSTTIRYGIKSSTDVSLKVYNMLGQTVATLVEGKQSAGWHNVTFDASGLSSGFYIYRIQAGDFVSTKKLMLIK